MIGHCAVGATKAPMGHTLWEVMDLKGCGPHHFLLYAALELVPASVP